MQHKHRPQSNRPLPIVRSMVTRLRRQTPNCGYAEVDIISHPGSHHKEGDVVLMDWDEYQHGRTVKRESPLKPDWNTPVGKLDAATIAALDRLKEETEMVRKKAATKPTTKPRKTGKKPVGRVAAKKKTTPTATRKKPNANPRKPRKAKGGKATK